MTDTIYFSIITPFHNRKDVLLRAVNSVLSQTHQFYELILIDDASTDGTLHTLATHYADKIATNQIKLLRCPHHQGAAMARNLALASAKNPWIFYLDSDNFLYPYALEIFAKAIIDHPTHQLFYACCDMASTGKNGHSAPFDQQRLLKANFIDLGVFVHAREVYKKLGGFDTQLQRLMDWDLIIRYTQDQEPLFIPYSLMLYNDLREDKLRITLKESLGKARYHIWKKHKKLRQSLLKSKL